MKILSLSGYQRDSISKKKPLCKYSHFNLTVCHNFLMTRSATSLVFVLLYSSSIFAASMVPRCIFGCASSCTLFPLPAHFPIPLLTKQSLGVVHCQNIYLTSDNVIPSWFLHQFLHLHKVII